MTSEALRTVSLARPSSSFPEPRGGPSSTARAETTTSEPALKLKAAVIEGGEWILGRISRLIVGEGATAPLKESVEGCVDDPREVYRLGCKVHSAANVKADREKWRLTDPYYWFRRHAPVELTRQELLTHLAEAKVVHAVARAVERHPHLWERADVKVSQHVAFARRGRVFISDDDEDVAVAEYRVGSDVRADSVPRRFEECFRNRGCPVVTDQQQEEAHEAWRHGRTAESSAWSRRHEGGSTQVPTSTDDDASARPGRLCVVAEVTGVRFLLRCKLEQLIRSMVFAGFREADTASAASAFIATTVVPILGVSGCTVEDRRWLTRILTAAEEHLGEQAEGDTTPIRHEATEVARAVLDVLRRRLMLVNVDSDASFDAPVVKKQNPEATKKTVDRSAVDEEEEMCRRVDTMGSLSMFYTLLLGVFIFAPPMSVECLDVV